MCGGVIRHAAGGSPGLQCIAGRGFFYDSKAGHMYNLLDIYTTAWTLEVEGKLTIAIDSAMSARLLAIALDLFPPALVAGSSHAPPFLHRQRRAGRLRRRRRRALGRRLVLHSPLCRRGLVGVIVDFERVWRGRRGVLRTVEVVRGGHIRIAKRAGTLNWLEGADETGSHVGCR